MILANHGATRAHIIVADEASAATWRAAEELSRYLYEMTGANLTIHPASRGTIGNQDAAEICVGQTGREGEPDITGLKNDGYILKTVGNRLFILGENDRAVLHAAYAFLEDVLGCRFFTDTVEHVPQRAYLAIGEVDKTVISPFEYREVFGNVCYDDDEFASKRVNGRGYQLDEEHGGSILYQGFVHTFNHFVPVFEFFDEHPEYFSMVNGKRFDGGDGKYVHGGVYVVNTQLCLSNPDVLRIVTERLRKEIEEHPEATIFSVSQNDWGEPCQCPECAKVDAEEGSYAGSLLRFVNKVAVISPRITPMSLSIPWHTVIPGLRRRLPMPRPMWRCASAPSSAASPTRWPAATMCAEAPKQWAPATRWRRICASGARYATGCMCGIILPISGTISIRCPTCTCCRITFNSSWKTV